MSALLEVSALQTAYGTSQVLFGVSFALNAGEAGTLLGRNGMGKTTTVRSVLGLTASLAGTVRFRGESITGLAPDRVARKGLALVPEGRQIFPILSVKEKSCWRLRPNAMRLKRLGRWMVSMRCFRAWPNAAVTWSQLSGGEQQMLAIGRALMTNPHLLILDEATEGLAPMVREEIWRCLAQLRQQGQSILVIDKYVHRLMVLANHHTVIEVWPGGVAG